MIRQIGLALLSEALTTEPVGRLYAESLGQTLALHLVRHYSVSRRAPDMFRGGLSGYNLRRAKEYINEHLEQDLSLAGIAESVGLSQFHFAREATFLPGLLEIHGKMICLTGFTREHFQCSHKA